VYKWEITNHSTGEIIEPQIEYKSKENAIKGAVIYVLDPRTEIALDHDISLVLRDSTGDVVGGLKDFPARRLLQLSNARR